MSSSLNTSYKCKTCKKVFETPYKLNYHKFVLSKFCNEYSSMQESFSCNKCNKNFISKAAFDIHIISSFKCCPKNLREYVQCNYCDKKFVLPTHRFIEPEINTNDYLADLALSNHYKTCIGKFSLTFDSDEIIDNLVYQNNKIDSKVEEITDPTKLDTIVHTNNGDRVIPFVKDSDIIPGHFKIKAKVKRINQNKKRASDPWD